MTLSAPFRGIGAEVFVRLLLRNAVVPAGAGAPGSGGVAMAATVRCGETDTALNRDPEPPPRGLYWKQDGCRLAVWQGRRLAAAVS